MTEKNSDVEWLRTQADEPQWLTNARARRLLAHIDKLEAEVKMLREAEQECSMQINVRPTVHEIAAQMMAGMLMNPINNRSELHDLTEAAYKAAEALVAEGRRRDGQA